MASVLLCALVALVALLAGAALSVIAFVAALMSPTGKADGGTKGVFYGGLVLIVIGLVFAGAGVWTVATW